jgi:hypothetical protein
MYVPLHQKETYVVLVDFEGFWRWCMMYRTMRFILDFIHRLVYMTKKYHNVSETGSVSVLRWMGQDRPTQFGPLERASLNHWTSRSSWVGLSCPIHLRTETDPVSETLWYFFVIYTRRWIKSKINLIVLYIIHHRQNPLKSRLVFVAVTQCFSCEVRTEFLYCI